MGKLGSNTFCQIAQQDFLLLPVIDEKVGLLEVPPVGVRTISLL